ncbi:alcohol dehydrogenase [Sinimarinibacterium sp. CAU 1509]|uniref:synaptic vesicle VAT-1 family membrane protein n=1 Tax=Sinimarinibacterium sp. CAU 1509 TaxID=2562283 RepID=UPI0010AB7625|nr:medium chain dehydrogenase/reductase family protein [Sinimarinibacterium sp. CAU 1509]TJY59045.1 alcohol dehydrogenase [Sinimarinibacterium sp. CAU 1509]
MQQIYITGAGGLDKLELRQAPDPTPGPDTLRVRVHASGVNFADIMARQGLYPDAPKTPCVVGYEVSGVVDAVGDGVDTSWVGKPVFGLTRFGGYADTVIMPIKQVFEKPESLSHAQAAAIPVNYLTAWQLLVVVGALTADESVLIHNVGGGVGLAAIDIARHVGATIYGTASSGKHAFLKDRGLHHAIDYTRGDWMPELMRLTQDRGVELITDPLGGSHWKKSYKALRATGRLGMFGISTATESGLFGPLKLLKIVFGLPLYTPLGLMDQNRGVFGVNMGHLWHEVDKIRTWMETLLLGVEQGWVRPHVDKTFALADVGQAHAYIEARKNIGKVVLTV